MIGYFILLGIVFMNSIIKNKQFFYLTIGVLIIFSGLRYYVGMDYTSYYILYNLFNVDNLQEALNIKVSFELGFKFINYLLNKIGFRAQALIFLSSAIHVSLVFSYIKKWSKDKRLSLAIYVMFPPFYFYSFSAIRQTIASAIFVYSLRYLEEKRIKQYVIFVFIASLFHKSAITLILLYFILDKPLSKKLRTIVIFSLPLLGVTIKKIISMSAYSMYIGRETMGNNLILVILIFYSYLLILNMDKFKNIIVYNMIFLSNICLILSVSVSNIFLRYNVYFFLAYLIFIPSFFMVIKNNFIRKIFRICFILLLLIYTVKTLHLKGIDSRLLPYNINLNFL